jgi:hypothetical protein
VSDAVDPHHCPLCGEPNSCGMAEGKSSCWCFEASIDADTLARIPPEAQGKSCICRGCAVMTPADALVRKRG